MNFNIQYESVPSYTGHFFAEYHICAFVTLRSAAKDYRHIRLGLQVKRDVVLQRPDNATQIGGNIMSKSLKLNYQFKNEELLRTALTHSSYANENKSEFVPYNERLEFLGDAVLGFVVGSFLYKNYEIPEGELSKLRASVVCEAMLSQKAKNLGLGENMRFGNGEEKNGGRTRVSILADAFEAVIGAIYLDGGIAEAKKFILWQLEDDIHKMKKVFKSLDSKTNLQEYIQKSSSVPLVYEIVSESGPAHKRVFEAQVKHNGNVLGKGNGTSKKEAEQTAAADALKKLQTGYKYTH